MDFYQIMRAMKLIMVMLTCFFLQISAKTVGQTIALDGRTISIPTLLKEIRNQTDYDFIYDSQIFKGADPVSVKVQKGSIQQVLDLSFHNRPYTYSINGKVVSIRKKEVTTNNQVQQNLNIRGKVIHSESKRPIAGVSIKLKGGKVATSTDKDGNFMIQIPKEGGTLIVTSIGFKRMEIPVSPTQISLTISLQPDTESIMEISVTVQARKKLNTEAAILDERRKSAIVQDAISAQQIERTASITTTQALQRVSGVTVTDEKYVAVRGLGDRSVIGQLNGIRLASANPDRSTIPLDLVPATLLDNITVFKTLTPDKPADAAAGIVELKTKSVPDKEVFEIVAQTGNNSNIGIGGSFNSFWNSEMGVFGEKISNKKLTQDFKDLANQYKGGMEEIQRLIANSGYNAENRAEVARINDIMQSFDPVLTTQTRKANLNQLYSINYGNSFTLFDEHKLGLILGGNYYHRYLDNYAGQLNQYSIFQGLVTGNPRISSARILPNFTTPNTLEMGKALGMQEHSGIDVLNYGFLGGLTYRFNPRHEISFQYLGSWGAESEGTSIQGEYLYSGLSGEVKNSTYSLKQTQRSLKTFNLQGEHKLWKTDYAPQLSYNLANSTSYHNNPDFRFIQLVNYAIEGGTYYETGEIDPNSGNSKSYYTDHLYALSSGYVNGFGPYGILQAEPNGRRWRTMEEKNYNYKADLSVPFHLLNKKQIFKVGFNYLNRDRVFDENVMFLPGSNFTSNKEILLYKVEGDLNKLVSNDVIGVKSKPNPNEGGIPESGFLYNTLKSPNNYTGYFETYAIYGMLDFKPIEELRFTGGVRFETTDIQAKVDTTNVYVDPSLTGASASGNSIPIVLNNPNSKYKTGYKPYFSGNLTYSFRENMNFRLGFNQALARPELREITNVFEFDVYQMGLVVGNKNLINQKTENADFRFEWFPNPGEVIAFSVFGKRLNNQLVKVYSLRSEGVDARFQEFPTIQFQNDPNTGYVWGIELEAVQNLGKFHDDLQGFSIGSNLLIAQSEVKKTEDRLAANRIIDRYASDKSPIFEQAPYSINGWLNFEQPKWGTNLTTTFNMVGERLVQINLTGEPDLYSRPAPTLDFVFSQKINKNLIIKGYAKNILNPPIKTVYSNAQTGGKWYGTEYINRSYKRGMECMLGISYNLY